MSDQADEPMIDFVGRDRFRESDRKFQGVLWGFLFAWAVSLPFVRLAGLPEPVAFAVGVLGATLGHRVADRHPGLWDEDRELRWPWWATVLVVAGCIAHLGLYIYTD
jgi:hypothetical protein